MAVRVYVTSPDLTDTVARMQAMAERSFDMTPLMGEIGTILIGSVHETFAQEGRPKWKMRSPLTMEIYAGEAEARATRTKQYQNAKSDSTRLRIRMQESQRTLSNKILQNNGDLKDSIMLGRVTSDSVEIGSSLIYARIHQKGGTIVPKTAKVLMAGGYFPLKQAVIPARPYLGVHEEDYVAISRAVIRYVQEGALG